MVWKNDQVSQVETEEILRAAREVLQAGTPGDFVEFGCYKGDTSLLLAEVLEKYNKEMGVLRYKQRGNGGKLVEKPVDKMVEKVVGNQGAVVEKDVEKVGKRLWIYDSFEGLPGKSEADESVLGVDFRQGELLVSKREVKERFLRAGLRVPVIKKGWFGDLGVQDLPLEIAFAFLDGDFYESIRDSLRLVEKCIVAGGKLLVHDYNNPALPGVRQAVEEWMVGKDLKRRVVDSMVML